MIRNKELVVIGNGFDLSCGLKSKYSDFFNYRHPEFDKKLFKENFKNVDIIFNNIKKINGRIGAINDDLNSIKKSFPNGISSTAALKVEELTTELDNKKVTRDVDLINLYNTNNDIIHSENLTFWDYAFMLQSNENEKEILWCDIEVEILTILYELIEYVNNFESNQKLSIDSLLYGNDLSRLLFIYLNSNKFVKNYKDQLRYEELLEIYQSDHIYEVLLVELNKFESSFKEYIKEISFRNKRYINLAAQLFDQISRGSEGNYILNFNYTNPFRNNVSTKNIYHVNNVHGNLDDGEIIFGIDSFDEIEDSMIIFTKTNRIISLADQNSMPIPGKERINSISFFGHSLSAADYSYFLSLFDFYDIYNSHIKLKFCYQNFSLTAKKDLLKNITNLMTKYGESFDNQAKGKNLMHKLSLENRIIVEEIE